MMINPNPTVVISRAEYRSDSQPENGDDIANATGKGIIKRLICSGERCKMSAI